MNMMIKQSEKSKIVIDEINLSPEALMETIKWFLEQRLGKALNPEEIELKFVYEISSLFENEGETIIGYTLRGGGR